jgi:hypothetical protein
METMPKPTPMTPNRRMPPQPISLCAYEIMSCAPDFEALVKDITRSRRLRTAHATWLPS